MLGISSVATQLAGSQDELSSMKLIKLLSKQICIA
jgi:hypothetical protein